MQPNCGNSVTQRLHDLQGSVRLLGKAEGNHLQNPGTSLQTKLLGHTSRSGRSSLQAQHGAHVYTCSTTAMQQLINVSIKEGGRTGLLLLLSRLMQAKRSPQHHAMSDYSNQIMSIYGCMLCGTPVRTEHSSAARLLKARLDI